MNGYASADWSPFDRAENAAQLVALRRTLSPRSRVLDIGCGSGRVLMPLARAGHRVVGLDRDPAALRAVRRAMRRAGVASRVTLLRADLPHDPPVLPGSFDAILCLGHGFMETTELDDALHLLRWCAWRLHPGGFIALDDLPGLWREVAEGNWRNGVSEDGFSQFIWEPTRAVFALREGAAVRTEDAMPMIAPGERRFRLWTFGEIALLTRLARLSTPERNAAGNLLLLRKAPEPRVPAV